MVFEFLSNALLAPITKHIAKLAFEGDLGIAIIEGTLDSGFTKLNEAQSAKAKESIQNIALKTVESLQPLFSRSNLDEEDKNCVVIAITETLNSADVAALVLKHRFEPYDVSRRLVLLYPSAKDDLDPAAYGIYEQALSGITVNFCQTAGQLPGFNQQAAKHTLDALDSLANKVDEKLSGFKELKDTWLRTHRNRVDLNDQNERQYRTALRKQVSKLRLFGLDYDEKTPDTLPLETAYIPLKVSIGDTGKASTLTFEFSQMLDVLPLIGNRMLIEGAGGSGKSTLLQWTALNVLNSHAGMPWRGPDVNQSKVSFTAAIRKYTDDYKSMLISLVPEVSGKETSFSEVLKSILSSATDVGIELMNTFTTTRWLDRTPYLVRLRDVADGRLPGPEELPAYIAATSIGTPEAWVQQSIEQGKALFLLDGIDEVPTESRAVLAERIEEYLTFYTEERRCQMIVTSRPAAVQEPVWRRLFGPVHVAVREMSAKDVELFIFHWHKALAHVTCSTMDHSLVDKLIGLVRDRPSLTPLAETPLLCAAICYLNRTRHGEIPDRAIKLYQQVCEQLVHRLDEQRLRADGLDQLAPALQGLDAESKLDLLAHLAQYMVLERTSVLERDLASSQIRQALQQINAIDDRKPNDVLRALQERSGILRGRSEDEVEFAHNNLRAYLAARAFKDDEAVQQPIDAAFASDDPDLPVLVAALASKKHRVRLIKALIDKAIDSDNKRALQIMALRCGATGGLSNECQEWLRTIEASIFPPRSALESAQLAELGSRIVPQLMYSSENSDSENAWCVRSLKLVNGLTVSNALDSYLENTSEVVLDELAQTMNPLRIPRVLEVVRGAKPIGFKPLRHLRETHIQEVGSLGGANTINLSGSLITDIHCLFCSTALTPPKGLSALTTLDLSGTSVTDLTPLKDLSTLTTLNLSDTSVTDLTPLKDLSTLTTLLLSGTSVTDLTPLKDLSALNRLNLGGTSVTDLTPLKDLSALTTLDLSGTSVTDLTPLKDLSTLTWLDLSGTSVTDLTPLKDLSTLTTLLLSGTSVTDLTPLKDLSALTWLNLGGTSVTDLTPLKDLSTLTTLLLSGTSVTDLTPLKDLSTLTTLDLSGTSVTDLTPLKDLSALNRLNLSGTSVTDLTPLKDLSTLTTLDLSGTSVTDLTPLKDLSTLTWLDLSGTSVTDLTPLKDLSTLTWLDLSGTSVTDLTPLKDLSTLTWLDLSGTSVTDLTPLKNLSALTIHNA